MVDKFYTYKSASYRDPDDCFILRSITPGVKVMLVNEEMANYYGRVEIEYDGVRGTVCDYEWSTYDARVLCRQLGFPDGEAYKKAYYGRGNGSVVLSGM